MSRRNLVTDSTMVNTWGATPRASFGARFIKVKAPERPSGGSEKMLSEASRSRIQLLKDRLQEIEREAEAIRNEIETLNNATDYPKFRDAITLSSREKIALYQTLFFNRTDVFPKAWQSDKGSGWTPVCANEWKPGLCSKKLVKCHACANRLFVTLENSTPLEHFHGKIRIGMYAIDSESKCLFLATNFDGAIREKSGCALFATGSLVGEGVDIPAIDALILAFPISSRVKMTQYLGRIERESPGKFSVIAVDYEDTTHPITRSMFKKRASSYRALNYILAESLEAALHAKSLWES